MLVRTLSAACCRRSVVVCGVVLRRCSDDDVGRAAVQLHSHRELGGRCSVAVAEYEQALNGVQWIELGIGLREKTGAQAQA